MKDLFSQEPRWKRVGTRAEIESRAVKRVRLGGHWIALHVFQGQVYAVDDSCPHRGASLAEGCVGEDGYVECLHHGWEYDIKTGRGRGNFAGCIGRFPVMEKNGEVFVSPERLSPI